MVKNSPAKAGEIGDSGLIPGLGRSREAGHMAAHSSVLGWRIQWTEEPGRLQPSGSQRVRHDRGTDTHTQLRYVLYSHPLLCIHFDLKPGAYITYVI